MLRYYSYYSVGGYKDMYLGTSEMKEEEVFFLPLLPVWRKRAEKNNDAALADRVEKLVQLSSIKILTEGNTYEYPSDANAVISHGAYKILLRPCKAGESVLCFRDIENEERDESGRPIPYLIAITGSSDEDNVALRKICAYMTMNVKKTTDAFSKLFCYDAEKNGISFKLAKLNEWVKDTLAANEDAIVTVDGEYTPTDGEALVILPNGITREKALEEQGLKDSSTHTIAVDDVVPHDDAAKVGAMLRRVLAQRKSRKAKCLKIAGGAALAGFVLGFLTGYFCEK